jgi:SAM-dependent methyltransferase
MPIVSRQLNNNYPCTYCKQNSSLKQYDTTDMYGDIYAIHTCHNCNAWFLTPPPTLSQLNQAYDDSYYGEKEGKFNPLIEKTLDYFRTKRAKLITKHLDAPAKVLDIGCGNGKFLQYVRQQGNYQIYGIEIAGKAANRAATIPTLQLKKGMLEAHDFDANTFDAITLFHVFEHLTEPMDTLKIIQKILKPGGILVMSFPNIDSFQSKWFKGNWLHLDPPRHLFFFTPNDFKHEMNNYGFNVIKERYFSTEYNPFGMQQSLLNTLLKKREVLYEHLKGNNSYTQNYKNWQLTLQNIAFKLSYPLFVCSDLVESGLKKGATVEFIMRKEK